MKRRACASSLLVFVAASSLVRAAGAQPAEARSSPLKVHASLSRTAAWVGDRIVYTVEIVCPPGTDLLADDLGRDRLRLDGLELVDAAVARDTRPDGTTVHRARYDLTTFQADGATLRIHPLPVRYYVQRPGDRAENLRPAAEIEVPAQDIPLRSTLPAAGPGGVRDDARVERVPPAVGLLRPVALGAILLALAPVVLGTLAALARMRQASPRRRVRRLSAREREQALGEIRDMTAAVDVETRRAAFDRLDVLLREHLEQASIPAFALPPDEVERFVAEHRPGMSASDVGDLLRECERIRYTPAAATPAPDVLRDTVERAAVVIDRIRS